MSTSKSPQSDQASLLSRSHIKIFADGADLEALRLWTQKPWIKGITTNPSLMRKAGVSRYEDFCLRLLAETPTHLPISFEIFADDFPSMEKQALQIATWDPARVYVKIPVTNSKGQPSYELIETLSAQGIRLNVTAVFTPEQINQVIKSLKGRAPAILSVFAGRIADAGWDPEPLMKDASRQCQQAGSIELLWASTREVLNIVQAERCGVDIITVPFDLLKKVEAAGRLSSEELSLDTVKTFVKDSLEAGFSL